MNKKYHRPIIGIRVFHGGASAVVNNVAYYNYYGYIRCNLAQDRHLNEGVYAYVDIDSALSKINQSVTFDRTKCLGVVEGYLKHKHDDKLCLDSRSCKLIAVFSPWCTDISLPFSLGAEDALAFRLPPHQSGAPLRWFRQLYNLDGKRITKDSIKSKINSGTWSTPLPEELIGGC